MMNCYKKYKSRGACGDIAMYMNGIFQNSGNLERKVEQIKWAIIFAVSVLTLTQDHLMKKDFKSA